MNFFFSGFVCGFTLGLLVTGIIAVILILLAILSLTMDASDLPRRPANIHAKEDLS